MQRLKNYWLAVLCVIALGTVLNGPVLHAGYALDDFAQSAMVDGAYPAPRASWDLFNFADGSASDVKALTDTGFFPWWTHPEVRLAMFRPLSSWLAALDRHWFESDPFAQHVHSLVWWWAMCMLAACLFRSLLPAPWALVALGIFALDQPHPTVLGWLANRTALLSCTFGLLALLAYLRHRGAFAGKPRPARPWWALTSSLCLGLALSAGEYGLSFVGFFVAYECFEPREPLLTRARQLLWVLAPACCFVVMRSVLQFGGRHSGVYLDPLGNPGLFVTAVLTRFPVLVADYAISLRAEFWSFGLPFAQALHDAGAVDASWLSSHAPWRALHELIGLAALMGYVACLVGLAQKKESEAHRHVLWLGAGALISTLPLAGALPGSRLTLIPAVGASALLAFVLLRCMEKVRDGAGRLLPRVAWGAAAALVFMAHLVVGPAQAAVEASLYGTFSRHFAAAALTIPFDFAGRQPKHAVIVSSGEPTAMIYSAMVRRMHGVDSPDNVWTMSGNRFPFTLERTDPQGLILRYAPGAGLLSEPFEVMFRSRAHPLKVDDRFSVGNGAMRVQILSVSEAGPDAIYFHFDRPLEDPSWLFLYPTEDGLRPLTLPEVGESIALAPPPLTKRIVPYFHHPAPRRAGPVRQHASVVGLPHSR